MADTEKSWEAINKKIAEGSAVVISAEEAAEMSSHMDSHEFLNKVDVVTTATFGAMCSSGMFLNFGHPEPPIRMEHITLDGIEAYAGVAAVDAYLGATQTGSDNPRYGGAHVIEKLLRGEDIRLCATAKGTDCYPRKELETWINRDSINEMILCNPRNAYQNYPAAINSTSKTLHTYMGTLLPHCLNINYSTSGCLSPLMNDPTLRTIGIGSPVYLAGSLGCVAWNGTQFNTEKPRNDMGIPLSNGTTLMLTGNAKDMNPEWLRAAYFEKYGVSMYVGVGFALPVLDEDMARHLMVRNDQIETSICDYGLDGHPVLQTCTYAELMSGSIEFRGKKTKTAPLSSLSRARIIAEQLRKEVLSGAFPLRAPLMAFPAHSSVRPLGILQEKGARG